MAARRPGGEKSQFLAGFSPPGSRFALASLPSRGGMAPPELHQVLMRYRPNMTYSEAAGDTPTGAVRGVKRCFSRSM